MRNLTTILLISVLAFVGCSRQKKQQSDNVLLESYRLIDEQRDDEAIELLQNALQKDPNNREYRMTLASAYAHYAGIKIQKLAPLVASFDSLSKAFNNSKEISKISQVDVTLESWVTLLQQFSGIFSAYSSIPELAPDKVIYVEQAIKEINLLGKLSQNEAIYRGILRIILIKNKINTKLLGQFTNENPDQCKVDIDSMNQNILGIGRDVIAAMEDIQTANPDKAGEITQWKKKTADMVSDLSLITTSAMVLDEVSTIALKKSIIEEGFLKLLKCGIAH